MRISRFLFAAAILSFGLPSTALAASSLIKGSSPAVYYVDEGKRYVFPNEKVYFSWYSGFSDVRTVSDEELASYLIGGNVTYKPGTRLVKLQSDPRVFAVGAGGRLRWLTSETAARTLYGENWNKNVDDLSDAFFFAYKEGEPVAAAGDFDKVSETSVASIADDLAARNGVAAAQDAKAVKTGAWSDPAVWGGTKPSSGSRVTIPANVKVTYDLESGPTLKTLDVLGALDFAMDRSTRLAARQITVRGTMTAGRADAPIPSDKKIEIALTGAASTAVADDGLTIDGGTLALYGADVGTAWTRLASAAKAGATKITLESAVTWAIGSEIAILGATNDEQEIRRVKSVDGATITLDAALAKAHRSEEGLRSEVALLDRNIVIKGVGGGMGSYMRAVNHATVAVHGVSLVSLGRKGIAGQYPLLLDGLTAPSVSVSVIRDSGNRCLTLRQTNGAMIQNNVALGAYGHCFATEDGAETGNAFIGNLAARVLGSALASDAVPAAFLLKHPDNRIEGNAAVGSSGFGFWYLLADEAVRNSGVKIRPREAKLGTFSENVARANAKIGLYVDDGKGKGDLIPPSKASFVGLTSVLNGERGFWLRGVNLEVTGAYIAENPIGGTFAAFGATLRDSKVAGRLETSPASDKIKHGFTFDDGPVSVQRVVFSHFSGEASALGFEEKNLEFPDARNSISELTFDDAAIWKASDPATPADMMTVVRDLDHADVVGMDSDFLGASCVAISGNVRRCPGPYAHLEAALRDGKGDKNVIFTEIGSQSSVTLTPGTDYDGYYAYALVEEGGAYRLDVNTTPVVDLSYEGTAKPLLVRVPAGLGATVRGEDGANIERREALALTPGSWTYDGTTAEAVLWLNPGDNFKLIR